ncbi:heme peroxidase [Obelidium mucronatum]|nr:heme peroxidase [Obelidium mucronatum]
MLSETPKAVFLWILLFAGSASGRNAVLRNRAVPLLEPQSYDGSRNNLQKPKLGSTGDAYLRLLPAQYGPNQAPSGENRPNARRVSNILFAQPNTLDTKGTSDFLPAWGVTMHLDITVALKNTSDPFPIPVPKDDPDFDPFGTGKEEIPMGRVNYLGVDSAANVRIIPNAFTCWMDGSGLYGNSEEALKGIRAFKGGKLKSFQYSTGSFPGRIVGGPLDGYFQYSIPNVNISPQTLVFYLLFFREHNRRAGILATRNPKWTDEQIFQRARRWVISIIQRTTIDFYVPTLTGAPLEPYTGYTPNVNPQIDLFFSQVAFIYGHSGLNEQILRLDDSGEPIPAGHLLLRDGAFKNLCDEVIAHGIEPILRGFATQLDNKIDTKIVDDVRNSLPLNPGFNFDLVAIGIQRGRDLGFSDFNTYRRAFNLSPIVSWSDLTNDTAVQNTLKSLYPDINDLDPSVGIFAEDPTDPKSLVGPLTSKSIRDQFTRLRDGDRYWYQNPGVLTEEELQEFSSFSLGQMVVLNTQIKFFPDNPFVAIKPGGKFFLEGPSYHVHQNTSENFITALDVLRLSWTITEADETIHFVFESNATGWFGFGFGSNMLGADIYLCNDFNGTGLFTVQDSLSSTTQPVPSDVIQGGQNNVLNAHDLTAQQNYSTRVVAFSRRLKTGDPFDVDITTKDMDLIFAYSASTALTWHGALNRLHSTINFYASKPAVIPPPPQTTLGSLLILHSLSMYIAFIVLYPLGIYVARYHRNLGRWLSLHTSLLSSVTSNVVVAALTAIIGTFGNPDSLHYKIGMVVVALVGLSTSAGYFINKLSAADHKWSPLVAFLRFVHKYSGLVAYLVGLVDCYLGVTELSPNPTEQTYLQLIFLVTVFIPPVALFVYGERQRNLSFESKDYMGLNNLPKFRWEDVNHRVSLGAKWIVIDDVIYDVQKYMRSHPGGPHALNQMIGIDGAFAFNGRYAKKPLFFTKGDNTTNGTLKRNATVDRVDEKLEKLIHNHSRFARNLLSTFAMGTLRDYEPRVPLQRQISSASSSSILKEDNKSEDSLEMGMNIVKRLPVHVNTFLHYSIGRKILISGPNARRPVYLLRLLFDDEKAEMISRPGDSYLFQFVDDDGKLVSRSYTPIKVLSKGGIDFMIKMYNGEMTHYLMNSKSVRMRGPIPRTDLLNPYSETGCWKTLGLIAGGTGLTPMLLLIDYHLKNCPRDPTTNKPNFHIHLLFSNLDESGIFGVQDINDLEEQANGALTITYIVNGTSSEDFDGLIGSITAEVIAATMPKPFVTAKKGRQSGVNGMPTSTSGSLLRHRSRTSTMERQDDGSKSRTKFQISGLIPVQEQEVSRSDSESVFSSASGSGDRYRDAHEAENMAIVVCGPILMNVTVGDILRSLGYQNVLTI